MLLDVKMIGERIRTIRKEQNKSQEAFAEMIDTSTRTISNVENGAVVPSLQTVANIAEQCGCTIDSIVRRDLEE